MVEAKEAIGAREALQERCTRQSVQNAKKNAKFHSSPERTGQFTAGSATPNTSLKGFELRFADDL